MFKALQFGDNLVTNVNFDSLGWRVPIRSHLKTAALQAAYHVC